MRSFGFLVRSIFVEPIDSILGARISPWSQYNATLHETYRLPLWTLRATSVHANKDDLYRLEEYLRGESPGADGNKNSNRGPSIEVSVGQKEDGHSIFPIAIEWR